MQSVHVLMLQDEGNLHHVHAHATVVVAAADRGEVSRGGRQADAQVPFHRHRVRAAVQAGRKEGLRVQRESLCVVFTRTLRLFVLVLP